MNGKNIISDDQKIKKSNFYKNKKPFNIGDTNVDKILFSKRESYGKKTLLKILLGIVIMMTLDHYV